MKNFKKDLNDAAKAAKALALKIEKLQKQFSEMEKKHPKMPAKKAAGKKAVAKKAVAKKAAPKKARLTAADAVISAIGRSRKGVDAATIMTKTGFGKQKVYNTVSLLKKRGRIKATGRGRYAKT